MNYTPFCLEIYRSLSMSVTEGFNLIYGKNNLKNKKDHNPNPIFVTILDFDQYVLVIQSQRQNYFIIYITIVYMFTSTFQSPHAKVRPADIPECV